MKKNLAELQEKMKARMQNVVAIPASIATDVSSNSVPPPSANVQSSEKPLCSHCHRRVCRRGSALCSRCTGSGIQQELRDALPGMEVKKTVVADSVSVDGKEIEPKNWKAKRNSDYMYAGVQEGMRAATCSPEEQQLQDVKYYTRREVAKILNVSPTSICRWEQKGKTPPPIKVVRTGQLFYTEEHLQKMKEFMSSVVIVQHQPRAATPENQQHDAAKILTKKVFKMNRGIEKTVALQLGRGGLGKLI